LVDNFNYRATDQLNHHPWWSYSR